jgi:hypothetical protein
MYFVRWAGWSFEELDIKRNRDNSSDDGIEFDSYEKV